MKYKTLCIISLCSALTVTEVNGGGMKDLFDKAMTNFNASGSLDNKKGWSGGGGSFRAELVAPNIVSLELPTWSAGCGGIDFYGGSFSMINSDELVQALRGVIQGAGSYAFGLALGSVCPSCKDIGMAIQKRMQQINTMAKNSCQAATTAMGDWMKKGKSDSKKDDKDGSTGKAIADWLYEDGVSDDWSWAALTNDGKTPEDKANQVGKTFLGSVSHKFFVDANINSWNFVLSDGIDLSQVMMSLLGSLDRYKTGSADTEGSDQIQEKERLPTLTLDEFFKGPKKENNGKIKLWKCLNPTAPKEIACVGDQLVQEDKNWSGIVEIMIGKYKEVLGEIKNLNVEFTDPNLARVLSKLSISNDMALFLTKTEYDLDSLSRILGTTASVAIIRDISWNLRTAGKEINENPQISKDTELQRDKFHDLVQKLENQIEKHQDYLYKDLKVKVDMLKITDLLKNSNKA